MIFINEGKSIIDGNEVIVMAEFAVLAKNLREMLTEKHGEEVALKKMDSTYARTKLSSAELEAEVKKKREEILKDAPPVLKMFGEILAKLTEE